MKKYESKCVCVYDFGTFVGMAERLAKDFGRVLYFSPWASSFPSKKLSMIGYGLVEVERVDNFWDYIDEVDLFCFPDILSSDIQVHLRNIGKRVWGSFKGEELETDRVGIRELMTKLGLPVAKYEVIKGIDNLRLYLKEHNNVWVKVSIFREWETFKSINYKYIEWKLNEIEQILGSVKTITEFLVEEDLPNKAEIGYDGYCIDGKYPSKSIFGLEIKDCAYVSIFKDYKDFPKQVTDFNERISDLMKECGYRNFFSTEVRVGKDGKGYMTDAACRNGSPPNELMQYTFQNFSDIVWEGSGGKVIDPIPENKYSAEVIIHCNWAERNWLPVQYPKKFKDNLKFRNVTAIDGQHYIVPQYVGLPEIGAITTTGKTLDEAMGKIEEIADEIKGYYIEVPVDGLDKAKKEIEKLKSFGIDMFK